MMKVAVSFSIFYKYYNFETLTFSKKSFETLILKEQCVCKTTGSFWMKEHSERL